MSLKTTWVLCVLALPALAARADDAADLKAMAGTWIPTSAELGGTPFPAEIRESLKLVITGNTYSVTAGKKVDMGTVKLDASAKPKAIDVTGTEGPNKGKTMKAIYELSGDTLKVCYDLSGGDRPKEFKSEAGMQSLLIVYKREKK